MLCCKGQDLIETGSSVERDSGRPRAKKVGMGVVVVVEEEADIRLMLTNSQYKMTV